ncbi:sensor histidine kinase [Virgisporangium aurantiacum]|uniref:Signal transduction histidine-protein kinase/phosphatase MprB n=1 Tax=Virgisporangium aurantiacum TaxID=175570 RepID=A0A8J3Z1Y9_9ACTN|nr:HAMP domain-containing sensor histidine kinase [Virgisporangium aurantiacum]GIJ55951.1 two-component sensor histidine kinase [Virgisporangium aurantiacum]
MLRRLRIVYVGLTASVLVGLCVPLAASFAAAQAQIVYIDRFNDTAYFASLAEPALRTDRAEALHQILDQHYQLYGIAVAVIGRDGKTLYETRDGLDLSARETRDKIDTALAGRYRLPQETVWPWNTDDIVVVAPISSGGQVSGAIVTVSPSLGLRSSSGAQIAVLAIVSIACLLVAIAAAGPLTRWMLRPVENLAGAVHALGDGRFGDRVRVDSGPPELRRLAESFNRMADRIATLVERQRSFVSYASHQLRTPLATVRLCVDNIRPALRPHGIDDYELMAEEIERMGRVCDALLAYARAEVMDDAVEDVDAAVIADERVGVWRSLAAQFGVRLQRVGPSSAPARAAAEALDQSLDALLSNAIKFAGDGAEVIVAVESDVDGRVAVHVVDNGPGMPPEDLARAREPFWRRTTHQNIDGSGLGVTIADSLITASGGRLDLMTAQPHGVHAKITLPAAEPARGALRGPPAVAAPGRPGPPVWPDVPG